MQQHGNRLSHLGEDTDGVAERVILPKIVLPVDNYTRVPDTMLALQKETKLLSQQTNTRDEFIMYERL